MHCWIFNYFRLEDQVPENHLLRLIEKHISFAFVRERLKDSYSETGRPSTDPGLLLRILLIGYLYGVSSERKLVEELRMHLAWRWFTDLGFDQEIPHHSTFSKNRHGRFQESKLFEQLFEEIVARCLDAGFVRGDNLSVDGSFVEANAAKESRIPREQLVEAAQVKRTVRQYLVELEEQNPVEEPVHQQEQVSTTDPDSTYATKGAVRNSVRPIHLFDHNLDHDYYFELPRAGDERVFGWKGQLFNESEMALFSECMPECARTRLTLPTLLEMAISRQLSQMGLGLTRSWPTAGDGIVAGYTPYCHPQGSLSSVQSQAYNSLFPWPSLLARN